MVTSEIYTDELLKKAMLLSGYDDRKKVIDESITLFIAMQAQYKIADLRGRINWEGDLETLRVNNDNG